MIPEYPCPAESARRISQGRREDAYAPIVGPEVGDAGITAEQVALLLRFAVSVAACRRLKRDKRKGAKRSDRAWDVWLRKELPLARRKVLLEAARTTSAHKSEVLGHITAMVRYLGGEYRKVVRGAGRPPKKRGPGQQGEGLLPVTTAWLARRSQEDPQPFMYGLKLKLEACANGGSGLSLDQALLRAASHLVGPSRSGCRLLLAAKLDDEISDLRAAKHPDARERFGVSPATLAKRLQRARRRNPFPLTSLKD